MLWLGSSDGTASERVQWTPVDSVRDLAPGGVQLVEDAAGVLGERSGAPPLWPEFSLEDQCLVFEFVAESQAVAMGRCGAAKSLLLRRRPQTVGQARSRAVVPRAGHELGLAADVDVLVFSFPAAPKTRRDALDALLFVVHEAFHLNYQMRRTVQVPGERALQAWMGDAPVRYRGTAREYLENEYPRRPGVAALLEREKRHLRAALAGAAEGRQDGWHGRTLSAIDEVFGLMASRTALGGRIEVSEAAWELGEGIPTNLERRVVSILAEQGQSLAGMESVMPVFDAELDAAAHARIPFFIVTGGLKAALLDEIGGWTDWPGLVHPGRAGAGRTLNEVLLLYRNRLEAESGRGIR
jgi:hypothetical protein